MEYLYAEFAAIICNGGSPSGVPSTMSGVCDVGSNPTTQRTPFAQIHQNAAGGWKVPAIDRDRRRFRARQAAPGGKPGHQVGKFSYYTCKVEVIPDQAGSGTTLPQLPDLSADWPSLQQLLVLDFQYSIFFQGDMELAPAGWHTTITGDIAANGSIYMGASLGPPAGTLTLNNTINYLAPGHFN